MEKREFLYKEKLEKCNILVTGGLGFIGSNLCEKLIKTKAKVTIIDCLVPLNSGGKHNIDSFEDKVEVHIEDLRSYKKVVNLIKNQDIIFHLAGSLSHTESMTNPVQDLELNVRSTLSLLEACKNYNRKAKIVYTGSRSQYGRAKILPITEEHPLEPKDVNGIFKTATEQLVCLYSQVYEIPTICLRLTNVYGPRHQMRHSKQGFLNWFIRQALDDREIKIYGTGTQKRDFCYVDDVVNALILAGISDIKNGEIFNIGSEKGISVRLAAEMIIKIAGTGKLTFVPYPNETENVEVGDILLSSKKFHLETGWKPRIHLKEGLRNTIIFYRQRRNLYWD